LRARLALLEAADDLDRRRHTDIGLDEGLLDPLPRCVVCGVEEELLRERPAAARERVAQPPKPALPTFLFSGCVGGVVA
jgi:hypothetical protein